ncbi:MAG: non-canonical purine NTP pyrophosphatase [Candidatus Eremiobacteraeota bacterium]|nr:non-canonical purine NTP pyrophosphatase [Candidatus Eremiobacteraeota bacterium]
MKTYVATHNPDKLRELQEVFAGSPLELLPYEPFAEVEEDGQSYADNARLKADALYAQLREAGTYGWAVLADDSGLEVAALSGRPGVLSARYGGPDLSWPQRRARLLAELRDVPSQKRAGKFCCAIYFISARGQRFMSYGEVAGSIALRESGNSGFGYDPIFCYRPPSVTFADLSNAEKNAVSHRHIAAVNLLSSLRTASTD